MTPDTVAPRRPLRARLADPTAPAAVQADGDDVLLVDLVEAARRLAVAPRTLRRLAAEGHVVYVRLGRALRFRPADLAAFVARSLVSTTPTR